MTRINQIQSAILQLDPGAYQKLMDSYLMRKYNFANIMPFGSHSGTNKTTKGTPDSFVRCADGRFILIAYGTVGNNAYNKVESDILACLDFEKTGISREDIFQIICCHTSTNFNPGQVKQLCALFPNVELIGLGEVSFDLYLKYPELSRDHLHINSDTQQIFDVENFLACTAQNPYSISLDMPLLCREKEVQDIENLLADGKVLLLTGPSGIGKTRLALEVAKSFAEKEKYTLKVIRSNGENIYQDISFSLSDDNNYLLLVDDADQLKQLKLLFDMAVDPKRQNDIKIIMTVRDYAKQTVFLEVNKVIRPRLYRVEALSDDSVSQILTDNLGIKNQELKKRILHIAKGNIRLAIMAGMCALKNDFDKIKNTFDLFNDYYSDVICKLERDELITAAIVAFFNSFYLKDTELPFEIALHYGIDTGKFREICLSLHENEIIDIFENKAVKFENQNLRDYIFYYVFFKEKWITLSYMTNSTFPEYKNRLVFVLNTLMSLFNSIENFKYAQSEIRSVWLEIKVLPDMAFEFIKVFHTLIPEETLAFIKKEIVNMPKVAQDNSFILSYDYAKTKNSEIICSELVEILINFKYTDWFTDAIQLTLSYFERNLEHPMDMFFLFGKEWGIGYNSAYREYIEETMLLQQLKEYHEKNNSVLSGISLLFASSNLLRLEYSDVTEGENGKVYYHQFGVVPCESAFALRKIALESLFILQKDVRFSTIATKEILNYPIYINSEQDKTILAHDIEVLQEITIPTIDINDLRTCKILDHFERICSKSEVLWPESFPTTDQNPAYKLLKVFQKNYCNRYNEWDEYNNEQLQNIQNAICKASVQDLSDLWKILNLERREYDNLDTYAVGGNIDTCFAFLAKNDQDKFMACCDTYIACQVPYWSGKEPIITNLIEIMGFINTVSYIERHNFDKKSIWLTTLFDNIPDELINDSFKSKIENCLLDDQPGLISLRTALRIERMCPGFLVSYTNTLNSVSIKKPWISVQFFFEATARAEVAQEIIQYYENDIDILMTAYIYAAKGRDAFDYHGLLLSKIIHVNKAILTKLISAICNDRGSHSDVHSLNNLWEEEDYLELISVAVDALRDNIKLTFWNSIAEKLLSYSEKKDRNMKKDVWLKHYIARYSNDSERMEFLFNVICNCDEDQAANAAIYFCHYNKRFDDFKKLTLLPTHVSWSDSEIPVIEKQISFLARLKDELTGFELIEHREEIATRLQSRIQWKEDVLVREFIEDR